MATTNPRDQIKKLSTELSVLGNEDLLNIDLVPVNVTMGTAHIKDCKGYLKKNSLKFEESDALIEATAGNYAVFYDLFATATKLANATANYATGLRMYFGLVNGEKGAPPKMKLLYKPVGLVKKQDTTDGKREYTVTLGADYYEYKTGAFVKTTDTSFIDNYKNPATGISMIHIKGGNVYDAFEEGYDVGSVTFSFQEIFALIYDNSQCNVSIYNSIKMIAQDEIDYVKHCLLLAPPDVYEKMEVGPLTGVFANLAHLCPPHCNRMVYKLD
jgi:hypothetical protein